MRALVLDASAAIAFLDTGDAHHRAATKRIADHDAAGGTLLVPISAYSEMLVRPLRTGTSDSFEAFVDRREVALVPIDRSLARIAAQLGADHPSLQHADALVLATAHACEAELLTFDDRLRRIADTHLS